MFAVAVARSRWRGQAGKVREAGGDVREPGTRLAGCASLKGTGMAISPPGRRQEPIYAIPMALALVLAAIAGAGLGFVWQSATLEKEDELAQAAQEHLLEDSGE